MPEFVLRRSVHENVRELRRALGSLTRELSREDLAKILRERHSDRDVGKSSVTRWEDSAEPDIESMRIMAKLAGVTFEQFAVGDPNAAVPKRGTEMEEEEGGAKKIPLRRPQRGLVIPKTRQGHGKPRGDT